MNQLYMVVQKTYRAVCLKRKNKKKKCILQNFNIYIYNYCYFVFIYFSNKNLIILLIIIYFLIKTDIYRLKIFKVMIFFRATSILLKLDLYPSFVYDLFKTTTIALIRIYKFWNLKTLRNVYSFLILRSLVFD